MVLAAGRGTRMRPLTDTLPKPLVPLAGQALIDNVLDRLALAGVTTAVVNVHHFADLIEAHLKSRTVPRIIFSDERDSLLDTGGGVLRALPLLGEDAFFIHNSDSVWIEGVGKNLDRLAQHWDSSRMDSLLLLATASASLGYEGPGDFHMDPHGLLTRRAERRVAPFIFTGVSIAHPRLFRDAPQGKFSLNLLWDRAIAQGRLYGVRLEGLWMHVGTVEALDEATARIERGESD